MSDELESLEKAYPPFSSRLTLQKFRTRVNSLRNEMEFCQSESSISTSIDM